VELTLRIPDEIAAKLSTAGNISRRALEALAADAYRDHLLTLYEISELLGFSRIEAEDFLGRHQVPLSALDSNDLDREAALFEAASRPQKP
jgi:predicted HTH domain antitoxin